MENIAEKTFAELKEDISTYVELRLELLKLNTYERVAKTMAVFSYGIVLVLLAFFAILFLFLALGFFLGELLGSMALGFVLVVGMYLLLFGITMFFKRKITSKVMNEIITAMMSKDEKDNEETTDPAGHVDGGTARERAAASFRWPRQFSRADHPSCREDSSGGCGSARK